MGCYKRKLSRGIRWRYRGEYLGVKYHSKAIFSSKAECAKAEREKLKEIEAHQKNPYSAIMLSALMTERLDDLQLNRSEKYYKENKRYLKYFLASIGDKPVLDVTKLELRLTLNTFRRELLAKGSTSHKANSMLRAFKSLFFYAIDVYDLNIQNPCRGIKPFSVDIKLKFIPSDEDMDEVVNYFDQEEALLFQFAKETGCRINEALRLSAKDVLGNTTVLYTRKSKNSNLTPRKIPTPDCIRNLQFSGKLFNRWSAQPRYLEKVIMKTGQRAWNWHNLRHRYASILSKEGKPIFEIMQLLGHSNISTTQKYLQLLN